MVFFPLIGRGRERGGWKMESAFSYCSSCARRAGDQKIGNVALVCIFCKLGNYIFYNGRFLSP